MTTDDDGRNTVGFCSISVTVKYGRLKTSSVLYHDDGSITGYLAHPTSTTDDRTVFYRCCSGPQVWNSLPIDSN